MTCENARVITFAVRNQNYKSGMKKATITLLLMTALTVSAQDSPRLRTEHLALSGPTMAALGGPGPHFYKYNSDPTAGSAVREGLMPNVRPFVDAQVRDAVICVGHDGRYYMTGSTGDDIWRENAGVELWVSSDLRQWDYMGLVWSFDRDGTWQREWRFHKQPVRALWAPELHYVSCREDNGTVSKNYFITISMPPGDRGLLKSTTGRPEGPYVNALAGDGKWDGNIDASLFEDEDGTVYVLWAGGMMARMKDDMSGMAEEPWTPQLLEPDTVAAHHAASCPRRCGATDVGHEGASMFKRSGLYYLTAADTYEGRYSSVVAISENIHGPYRMRHEGVPCGGGTGYFRDHEGRWWCTMFGNDSQAPFREMPGMIRVDFLQDGRIIPHRDQPFLDAPSTAQWEAAWLKVWKPMTNQKQTNK